MSRRKVRDFIMQLLIYLSALFTISILVVIIIFILYKGLPGINKSFLTNQWEEKTTFVYVNSMISNPIEIETQETQSEESNHSELMETQQLKTVGYIKALGITIGISEEENVYIKSIDKNSPIKSCVDSQGNPYEIKKGYKITRLGDIKLENSTLNEAIEAFDQADSIMKMKVVRPGGGILPMLVSTLYLIVLSLIIAAPIGILSAIYLNEYARAGRLLRLIRFAILSLAGIPSIIYGLFGMLVFVQLLRMQYSILAGSLTLSIILLPTIISSTEEALKAIPSTYRESSLGLGATKLQTNYKVVLPGAIPGILVAIILSIGRIVGESAALMLTAGTVAQIPKGLIGSTASAATLTTKLYQVMKEEGNIEAACSIGIVLLALIVILNMISKLIMKRFLLKQGK